MYIYPLIVGLYHKETHYAHQLTDSIPIKDIAHNLRKSFVHLKIQMIRHHDFNTNKLLSRESHDNHCLQYILIKKSRKIKITIYYSVTF